VVRLAALSEPTFRRFWLGRTASTFGDSLVPVATAFAVLRIGGGATGIGYVLGAFTLSQVAFLPVGGVWADRLPRRLVMLTCDAVRAVVQVAIAVALLTGEARLWMLVVGGTVFGAASAFFMPASAGLIPQTVSAEHLQEANGLVWASQSGVRICGPALSGVVVAAAQPGWVFVVDAATFVVSAAFLARLEIEGTPPARQRFFAELGEGWQASASARGSSWASPRSRSSTSAPPRPRCSGRSWRRSTSAARAAGARSRPRAAPARCSGRSARCGGSRDARSSARSRSGRSASSCPPR
jgi:MFS family permease